MEIFNEYWKKEYTIDKKYKIKGWSRGGLQTGFILEPSKIFLDAGIPAIIKPNMILITHAHQDHINSLYNHLLDTKNVPVICSIDIVNFLQDYLNANKSLNALQKSKFNNSGQKLSKILINNPFSLNILLNSPSKITLPFKSFNLVSHLNVFLFHLKIAYS